MNLEEIRMNKGLLKEIGAMKKQQILSQVGRSTQQAPTPDLTDNVLDAMN